MTPAVSSNPETENKIDAPTPIGGLFQGSSPDQHSTIPTEAQASLDRLLAHEAISRAPRLRAVLKFMIDALLEGTAKTINEQKIGEAVFGRPAGYNPAEDNIVRVTIRHLRERIEEFYRTEGRDEKYVFKIPKGKYEPILSCVRADQDPQLPTIASVQSLPEAAKRSVPAFHRFASMIPWIMVVALAATVAVLGFRAIKRAEPGPAPQPKGILSLLLSNGKQTTVVVTDSNLEAYRMMFRRTVPLNAYLDRSYLHQASDSPKDGVTEGAWAYAAASGQTSMASLIIASAIQAASPHESMSLKYPHDLSMRDIEHGNYIFLGGPWINPWEQLFEDRLNFRIVPLPDKPWLSNIRNMQPLPSEPTIFALHNEGALSISYVRFVLLRNPMNDGYFVLLSGTSEEAVEAGGRFLMSDKQLSNLLETFKVASPSQLPSFEVIIETSGLQYVPENFRVVAARRVSAQ